MTSVVESAHSYAESGIFKRQAAEESLVATMQDEQTRSANELSDFDADTDSASEDQEEALLDAAASTDTNGSHTPCMTSNTGDHAQYSRELVVFYLYGKILPRHDHFRSDSVRRRLTGVKQLYHNIPSILHFSYSTVAVDKIGVSASQPLPKDTMLGPYSGKYLAEENINTDIHNQWLWEVYGQSGIFSYIDGSDPKYGNWMSFIQCARTKEEQNLKLAQQTTHKESQLYFVATRDIEYGQELLVWYGREQYKLYLGLPIALRRGQTNSATDSEDLEEGVLEEASPATQEDTDMATNDSNAGSSYPLSKTNTGSTCTDDSGVFTSEQEQEFATTQTLFGEVSPTTSHPPLLRPLTKTVTEEVSIVNEPVTLPVKPTTHITYTFIQPPTQLTPQYSYIGVRARDSSYSPQPSPRRATSQTPWLNVRARSRSRSPIPTTQTTPETNTDSGDIWRTSNRSNSPKSPLLYGMFTRSEDGSRWRCSRCERQFNSQGSLRAHARIHTGERPYKCKFCSRTFCQASTLRSHERLHTGEKPYKCGVCGRAFTQSAGLRSHLKTHMGGGRFEQ